MGQKCGGAAWLRGVLSFDEVGARGQAGPCSFLQVPEADLTP